mmetsp:Transcript_3081/g.5616  ORF Transcript_3081/g.5616 Transcript_3081/m.5616 type:complete len:96 (-) Transcript_3081:147-434(-)
MPFNILRSRMVSSGECGVEVSDAEIINGGDGGTGDAGTSGDGDMDGESAEDALDCNDDDDLESAEFGSWLWSDASAYVGADMAVTVAVFSSSSSP